MHHALQSLIEYRETAVLHFHTLGKFSTVINDREINTKDWGRDKTIQLIQFFITSRHRKGLHKEQIIDRLWPDSSSDEGNRDFKIAYHGVNKALEPNRKSREEPKFIIRQGLTYQLNNELIWIDSEAFDQAIEIANALQEKNIAASTEALEFATKIYEGTYLPNRVFEDWSSLERERLQLLAINAMITLGERYLHENADESIRLAQKALIIDATWEEAYRLQMMAYRKKGNRPQVIKTFNACKSILE
ncbi:MAG: BTAD domain-containing putative transcriptional regulator, partial [Saprospiraceae bacterium]|nr:BTAD domain-containing putative transcriptional regulator [Saprospiraceae bacterium]